MSKEGIARPSIDKIVAKSTRYLAGLKLINTQEGGANVAFRNDSPVSYKNILLKYPEVFRRVLGMEFILRDNFLIKKKDAVKADEYIVRMAEPVFDQLGASEEDRKAVINAVFTLLVDLRRELMLIEHRVRSVRVVSGDDEPRSSKWQLATAPMTITRTFTGPSVEVAVDENGSSPREFKPSSIVAYGPGVWVREPVSHKRFAVVLELEPLPEKKVSVH